MKLPGITYKLRSIANRYGYGETRRRLLEDENVEIVILHHRAPVGVRMICVESLPYLRWQYTSMIRHNTNAAQRAKPHLLHDELRRFDLIAAWRRSIYEYPPLMGQQSCEALTLCPVCTDVRADGEKVKG